MSLRKRNPHSDRLTKRLIAARSILLGLNFYRRGTHRLLDVNDMRFRPRGRGRTFDATRLNASRIMNAIKMRWRKCAIKYGMSNTHICYVPFYFLMIQKINFYNYIKFLL